MIRNSRPDGGYVLDFGGKRIPFRIEYRKRKKLAISVYPELRLEIVAPEGCTSEQVLPKVEKRAGWILRQWRYFEQFLPADPGRHYVSGETHLYLGRQYRLRVRTGTAETVKLIGSFLNVWTADREYTANIGKLVEDWYREHSERLFPHRLRQCLKNYASLKLAHEPRLTIRKMTHRWGSCTKSGNILLNLELIKAPIHCIDYVIVHELCHLKIHNHSAAFYRLLNRSLPDWEARKKRLESVLW